MKVNFEKEREGVVGIIRTLELLKNPVPNNQGALKSDFRSKKARVKKATWELLNLINLTQEMINYPEKFKNKED